MIPELLELIIYFFPFFCRAVSELAEALRDSDDVKKQGNEWAKENKDLRERLESLEKEIRIKSLQPRSPGNYNISSFFKMNRSRRSFYFCVELRCA